MKKIMVVTKYDIIPPQIVVPIFKDMSVAELTDSGIGMPVDSFDRLILGITKIEVGLEGVCYVTFE
jgi:hypothetical protein